MNLITSNNPKTVTKTFNHWWLAGIEGGTVKPSTPGMTFCMKFIFVRGNRSPDGIWELSPFGEDIRAVQIDDVFAFAAEEAAKGNTVPAELMEGIINYRKSTRNYRLTFSPRNEINIWQMN